MISTPLGDYLDTVRSLWPNGGEPRLAVGGSAVPSPAAEFYVLPSARSPRLLVPVNNRGAASRAMLRFSMALSHREVAKRIIVAGLLLTPWPTFRGRITVPEMGESLQSYLTDEVFHQHVDLSLGLGTVRANRKPVLQVFDSRGRSLAFVKVGTDSVSKSDVSVEKRALVQLSEGHLPAKLEVPRLIHFGDWNGAKVLVLSSLAGRPPLRAERSRAAPVDMMRALHAAFGSTSTPMSGTPLFSRLLDEVALVQDPNARETCGQALKILQDSDQQISVGAWHGDWTPWNMSSKGRSLQVWDWERFERGVPWGLDVLHYLTQSECRRHGMSTDTVERGLSRAEDLLGPRPNADLITGTYLATISLRYVLGSQDLHGQRIAPTSAVMLRALARWVEAAQAKTRSLT